MSVDDAARPTELDLELDAGRSGGTLVVAWQHPERRLIQPVGLLEHGPGLGYRFRYLRRAAEIDGFLPFLGFPDLRKTYVADDLFPLFSQRIMSDRRPDYGRFLEQLHLDSRATPWTQLARSEGRRIGDTVQVFPVPTVDQGGLSICRFLVHGIRHVVSNGVLPPLVRGDRLRLADEPTNHVNANAIQVRDNNGALLGYVPDLLLEHVRALQGNGVVSVTVEHANGPEAPSHLRLLARMEGTTPSGYRPMTGWSWATFDPDLDRVRSGGG